MRKILLFIVVLLVMSLAIPVFAQEELEIGLSMVPIGIITPEDKDEIKPPSPDDPNIDYYEEEKDFMDEWLIGFHFGYAMGILYASLDSFLMPPFLIEDMTSRDKIDEDTGESYYVKGFNRPGFLNFIDVGIRLDIAKIIIFAEAGVNHLYIYRQDELPEDEKPGQLGVNLRIGASYKVVDNLSIGITGTAIFPDFKTMGKVLKGLAGDEENEGAKEQLQFLPILLINLYL